MNKERRIVNQGKKDISSRAPNFDDVELPDSIMSEEEVRKKSEAQITPELLKFFNRAEARELVRYFSSTPSEPTSDFGRPYDLSRLGEEARKFLAREVKGRKIIELGNRGYANLDRDSNNVLCSVPAATFLELGAKSYEGCDPKYNADGLTFLLKQPDESAIVTSFGVLEDGVLHMGGCSIDHLLSRYTAELGRQIYRVTPKGAITLHGLDSSHDLKNAGFIIEENAPRDLKQRKISGELAVLRKK